MNLGKPEKDTVLSMCGLWQSHCDELEEATALASSCERALFDATDATRDDAKHRFDDAAKARDALVDRLDFQARAIFRTKAKSFQGVAAKLGVAIRESQPSPDDPMPPWPCLRSVLNDLLRLLAEANRADDAR